MLDEHGVLTTGQFVRLTGLPERTVQHRLGRLHRAGLVNRYRPEVHMGTAPYHVWLTGFGAAAIGAGPPKPWSEDPGNIRAAASLNELWLGFRDRGPKVGLHLVGWRRLHDGLAWRDLDSGIVRQLPVEAELQVSLGGEVVTALVAVRVVAILARFAAY